jgi:hypothetical protein
MHGRRRKGNSSRGGELILQLGRRDEEEFGVLEKEGSHSVY